MLTICRQKLDVSGISPKRASAQIADITDLNLGRKFELIIAPFRVFQGLETDEEVSGFFRTVRTHLSPEGTCILCAFKPREGMATQWASEEEILEWETAVEGGRVACFSRPIRIDVERQVIYPDLIYRRYRGDNVEDEAVLKLAMRYYYPEQFVGVVESHGFRIVNRWGGYAGERYGEGPELVLQFCDH
jgi:hypothetical protein